tara:strand:- start:2026 stop:4377 length:2352 start_codon:yes stop_codon:yes gene_type:complete
MGRQSSVQPWKPFEMVVDTTIAGASGTGNFQLILDSGYTYRYKVTWGDGFTSASTSTTNITHTYPSGGTYTIQIEGRFDKFDYDNSTEADKIIEINSWGNIIWRNFRDSFEGAANLTGMTTTPPIMEKVTSVGGAGGGTMYMFANCTNFDQPLGNWDMSKVKQLTSMFNNAQNFNQDIGAWDVSGAVDKLSPSVNDFGLADMFFQAFSFNNGGSPSISGWTFNSGLTSMSSMFENSGFNQPIGPWDVSSVEDMSRMFYNMSFNQDISTWNVIGVTNMSSMFKFNSSFNQPIGTWNVSGVTTMGSMFDQADGFDQDLSNWDVSNVSNMSSMFRDTELTGFNNSGSTGISGWTTSAVTTMYYMFEDNKTFNQPIGSWDVSNVLDMEGMFYDNNVFDQPLSGWNVSNVDTMKNMLRNTTFNQPIDTWVVTGVTDMLGMFMNADAFDQDIGAWDVSNVTLMSHMFRDTEGTGFNNSGSTSISGWTTSAVTDMQYMFEDNKTFNQPIGSWDTGNVTNMTFMFGDAIFNQDIGSWDVGKVQYLNSTFASNSSFNNGGSPSISGWTTSAVTNMYNTFIEATTFNQPLTNWDVSNVTTMSSMFANASAFDQDIGSWDVSGVVGDANNFQAFAWTFLNCSNFNNGGSSSISGWTFNDGISDGITMEDMFRGCSSFNQPLTEWNVSAVTSMQGMFWQCAVFDQDLSNWDVSNVTKMNNMFGTPSNLSNDNYNNILTGWTAWVGTAATRTLKSNVVFHAGGANYSTGTTAELARDYLTDGVTGLSWTITDGGGI